MLRRCALAVISLAAGDEGDNHEGRMAVEVLAAAVVDRGRPRVGMASRELDIAQRNTGDEGGHDERSPDHVWMDSAELGALADGAVMRVLPDMSSKCRWRLLAAASNWRPDKGRTAPDLPIRARSQRTERSSTNTCGLPGSATTGAAGRHGTVSG
jgi:hypothetical protein